MIDAYNDPYQEKSINLKKRKEFEKLKRTNGFKQWRIHQSKIQNNKCAWCHGDLNKSVVHVDHIEPLRFNGKNEYKNLVLSCRRCNVKKWIANNRVRPDWIIKNEELMKKRQRRKMILKQQQRLANEINEDIIADSLRWITQQEW